MVMEPPTPQCVGREFVRQYYTLLNQAPLHLHRFYNAQSSFVHGGIDSATEAEVVRGQQEIHQKIVQLNFKDCHAKIRKVDSHKTLAEGVVVQVSGELSNNGEPMRRFVQTFVLAPQSPKKYYVHNDIFRYQDEVFSEGETETSLVTGDEGRGLEEPIQKQIIAAVKPAAVVNNQIIPEPIKPEPIPVQDNFIQEPHMNGGGYSSPPVVEQASMEVEDLDWKSANEPSGWKEAAPEPWKDEQMVEDTESQEEEDETPSTPQAEEVTNSNEPMSWSSRVKMGAGGAKPPPAPAAAAQGPPSKEGTPFSQGAAVQGAKPYRGNRGTSQGRQSVGTPSAGPAAPVQRSDRFKDEEPAQGRTRMLSTTGDQYQLFVGNLPHNCTDEHLQELFGKYGKVSEIRINKKQSGRDVGRGGGQRANQVPNFGFVVFDEMSSVEKAMQSQPIMLYGTHRLNIEEKKTKSRESMGERGERPIYNDRMQGGRGERGSQDNLRGAGGHPGGGRGGDRGRGSGGGGRGGRGRGDFGRGRGAPPGESRGGFRGGGPRN